MLMSTHHALQPGIAGIQLQKVLTNASNCKTGVKQKPGFFSVHCQATLHVPYLLKNFQISF